MSTLRPFSHRLPAALFALCSITSLTAAQAREEITIYRDEFGTPHIFAATAEGACFGHGYAQAEDRLEELLKQYMRATGTMSEAFGPDFLKDDYRQRVWQHAAISKGVVVTRIHPIYVVDDIEEWRLSGK